MPTNDQTAPDATEAAKTADAVRVPQSYKVGKYQLDRIDAVLAVAEPLLGRKPSDPHAYVRQQPGASKLFVTMSSDDTIKFPKQHPREGQQRYRWEVRADGIELGYLVEEDA